MCPILAEIQAAYESGICYFEFIFQGEQVKIRMNKDHGRNSRRNDDQQVHNLSLVSENDPTCRVFRKSGRYLQWQVENIKDWEDMQEHIIEFLYQIEK